MVLDRAVTSHLETMTSTDDNDPRVGCDLSVIAPCYNESGNIAALVRRTLAMFEKQGLIGEIVLIDDASTDHTFAEITKARLSDSRVVGVRHGKKLGLFAGWRSGLEVARGRFVCLIDADLQNPPEEIPRLYRIVRQDAVDIAQAIRSSIGHLPGYILSRGLNAILNFVFGTRATDNKSGFILTYPQVLADILNYRFNYWTPQTFIRISAESKGYNIAEVETLFVERRAGVSFLGSSVPIKIIIAVLLDVCKAFCEFRLVPSESDLDRFLRAHTPTREPTPYRGWRKAWLELYFLTMPLHKWMIRRSATRALFYALRRSQYLTRADLDKYRLLKLKQLVRHAYNHVPYYRAQLVRAGLKPEDIQELGDIDKIPMLTKDDVRKNLYFDLFADNHKKREMLKISTSGSTGEPFVIYADKRQLEMRLATTMRATEWTGWQFGDRQARLWHQTIGLTWSQVVREFIDAWFMRRILIPAYELRDDNIKGFVEKIRKHKPVLIDAYAESLNFLGHYVRDRKIEGFRPKAIMSSAQILPVQVREVIEREFGAPVFDKYGAREFSGIAYEDDGHDGHLIMAESYIVELLKDGCPAKPGEVGEVVITDLNNYHVPIIRYRIGDIAQALDDRQPGRSGRAFPRIGRIEGRVQAVVVCTNGTWLPGTFFAHFFKEYDHIIRHYQVVQDVPERFAIKIVPGAHYSETAMAEVIENLRLFVGDAMGITVELVQEIPLVRTGKRNAVISNLKLDFQNLAAADDHEQVSDPNAPVHAEDNQKPYLVHSVGTQFGTQGHH